MKLGDVLTLSKGNLISIEDDKEYIIAGVQNYGAGILNKRKVKGIELTMKKYQLIKPNQLMWCKVDTKNGAFGITKIEHTNSLASTNMALADIDTSKCHPEFIEYLFRISFFHEIITKASSGTTNRKYLTPTQLFENIDLPDFNKDEQLEWLKKVDSIINSGINSELTHQLSLVKKLRQQLLQDAVQGKLVKQDKKDGRAKDLLEKIKAEKQKLIAEKKLKKEKELPPIKPEEIPFEIPENWVWCRLGDLCIELLGGYAFDSTRYSKTETKNQVIRLGNVKPNQLVLETTPVFINDDYAKEALRASLCEGDILITMTGTRAKKDYLFSLSLTESDFQTKNLFLNQRVGCFRFGFFIDNNYINIALKDVRLLNAVFESSTGAANQANIGIAALKDILIPLPPLAEKKRIVKKLDELIQYCHSIEASIKQSQEQNEKLLQQVLREALRKEPVNE